jgi:hypothetical protein
MKLGKMRPFQKKYVASLLAIIKTYCIESTAHGFKYIVSEPAFIVKMVWVGYSTSFLDEK